jgi:hypothetical protein
MIHVDPSVVQPLIGVPGVGVGIQNIVPGCGSQYIFVPVFGSNIPSTHGGLGTHFGPGVTVGIIVTHAHESPAHLPALAPLLIQVALQLLSTHPAAPFLVSETCCDSFTATGTAKAINKNPIIKGICANPLLLMTQSYVIFRIISTTALATFIPVAFSNP